MALNFGNLVTLSARWSRKTIDDAVRDAVVMAIRELSYGLTLPPLRPWWRKREDTITPVAGTQTYAFPTAQGTFESMHQVWFRTNGYRRFIEVVDDKTWADEADEDTTVRGDPNIANIHQSSGTANIRFSLTPSSSFISSLTGGVIRMDFFIRDALADSLITDTSQNSTEPLMPEARRMGIVWKAVEFLAIRQDDTKLAAFAQERGQAFLNAILADDIYRTGTQTRVIEPLERPGDTIGSTRTDYGHEAGTL